MAFPVLGTNKHWNKISDFKFLGSELAQSRETHDARIILEKKEIKMV